MFLFVCLFVVVVLGIFVCLMFVCYCCVWVFVCVCCLFGGFVFFGGVLVGFFGWGVVCSSKVNIYSKCRGVVQHS